MLTKSVKHTTAAPDSGVSDSMQHGLVLLVHSDAVPVIVSRTLTGVDIPAPRHPAGRYAARWL